MRQRYHTSYAKIRAASLLAVLGCAGNAMAATRSFDYNSSSAGSGVVYNGDYFWDATSTLWNDSSGTGTSTAWAAGDSAVFCAGTDVQSFALYDVHISANHVVNSITVEEGQPTFVNAGGSLTLTGAATISTTGGGDTLIQAPIAGSAGLVKDGPGTLYLSGMNTYTGDTTVLRAILSGSVNSIRGNVTLNNSILYLSEPASATFAGNIGGPGGASRKMGRRYTHPQWCALVGQKRARSGRNSRRDTVVEQRRAHDD